jgi:hypothetical protein
MNVGVSNCIKGQMNRSSNNCSLCVDEPRSRQRRDGSNAGAILSDHVHQILVFLLI